MEIKGKCSNCGKPNLIHRPWRKIILDDVFCGWCGTIYKLVEGKLVIYEVHNNHLTAKQKEKIRLENEILVAK